MLRVSHASPPSSSWVPVSRPPYPCRPNARRSLSPRLPLSRLLLLAFPKGARGGVSIQIILWVKLEPRGRARKERRTRGGRVDWLVDRRRQTPTKTTPRRSPSLPPSHRPAPSLPFFFFVPLSPRQNGDGGPAHDSSGGGKPRRRLLSVHPTPLPLPPLTSGHPHRGTACPTCRQSPLGRPAAAGPSPSINASSLPLSHPPFFTPRIVTPPSRPRARPGASTTQPTPTPGAQFENLT